MAGKYGELIRSKELIRDIAHYTGYSVLAHDGEFNADCSMGYHCISKPMSFDDPHAHDFHELLCFIGGNPEDVTDFSAEIECTLGEGTDKEIHMITSTAVLSIPPNLVHCPIVFKKVKKPMVFLEFSLTRAWDPKESKK